MISVMILFTPLVFAILCWVFKEMIGKNGVMTLTIFGMGCSAFLSLLLFLPSDTYEILNIPLKIDIFTWIPLENTEILWSIRLDQPVRIMFSVVNIVSFFVHIYSVGYMKNDQNSSKFMILLSLFTFFMLLLVSSDNLAQLFCGWEGVGLSSYLLIRFWSHKESANKAAMKAFIVNRVGDLGFLIAIGSIYYHFGALDFDSIFEKIAKIKTITPDAYNFIALMLFVGAMGKSAQFGLHTWLPDAMEGPTPVSALIHAATMVTAGVFLMVRLSPLIEQAPLAKDVILIVGALTSLFAATVATTQDDIKKIIAYSTCSQLGYMFMAIGVGFYTGALFHLFTHAFFKALLFLSAGSVIHAFSDEQNVKKMGDAWNKIPMTYIMMWIGSITLSGFPLLSGFYSKESILTVLHETNNTFSQYAYIIGIFVAFLTSLYSFRLLFLVFHGKNNADEKVFAHIHESPPSMVLPLLSLSILSLGIGYLTINLFLWDDSVFWKNATIFVKTFTPKTHINFLMLVPFLGLFVAWLVYIKNYKLNEVFKNNLSPLYSFFKNKWFIDELYEKIIITPILFLSQKLWKVGDEIIIEGLGPKLATKTISFLNQRTRALQTGFLSDYFIMILIAITLCISLLSRELFFEVK